MDPIIAQALASLIGAFTTAVLLAAGYYWGPNRREVARKKRRRELPTEGNEESDVE